MADFFNCGLQNKIKTNPCVILCCSFQAHLIIHQLCQHNFVLWVKKHSSQQNCNYSDPWASQIFGTKAYSCSRQNIRWYEAKQHWMICKFSTRPCLSSFLSIYKHNVRRSQIVFLYLDSIELLQLFPVSLIQRKISGRLNALLAKHGHYSSNGLQMML